MLLSENSGWREHGHLLPLHHRLERGANCNFRFAETNVATDQAIHWPWPFHIDFRVDDRLHLVWRFAERK